MGLKRKASLSLSLSPTPTPSTLSTSPNHTPQPSRSQFLQPHVAANQLPEWASPEPYFAAGMLCDSTPSHMNSRTRKRFRDGRPDEEIIHQNTLQKLYAGQNQQQHIPTQVFTNGYARDHDRNAALMQSPTPALTRHASSNTSTQSSSITPQKAKSQATISSFFAPDPGSKAPHHSKPYHSSPPLSPKTTFIPPAQALWTSTHTPAYISASPASIIRCEDCDVPLLSATDRDVIDTEMMDVDGPVIDCDIDQGWACARCDKRVCDVCAVRGDQRICLECANPGNGLYGGSGGYGDLEVGEKRWVGGIGWM